jgi:hypothetical protein
MTRYVSVSNGTVTLAGISWDGVTPYASPDGGTLIPSDTANVGDTYDGSKFTTVAQPVVVVVPATVTAAQIKMALQAAGLLTSVTAAVNASPDPLVPIYWNNASSFDRADARVAALGAAAGQTPAQMDAIFVAAAQYPDV